MAADSDESDDDMEDIAESEEDIEVFIFNLLNIHHLILNFPGHCVAREEVEISQGGTAPEV